MFAPPVEEMYPGAGAGRRCAVAGVGERLEAASRPTHFAGVATVVAKLFAIAGPCRAYFGEKDFQQLAVVRRMVADLSFPVEVVGCPTVREPDGLALSSRNVYLTAEQRAAARCCTRALRAGPTAVPGGERRRRRSCERRRRTIVRPNRSSISTMPRWLMRRRSSRVDPLVGDLRLLVAARFGRTRLIDNVGVLAG